MCIRRNGQIKTSVKRLGWARCSPALQKDKNNMSKSITIVPATGGQYRDLKIEPGTTVRDIRQTLGFTPEQVLTKGKGTEPIPDEENLYETLPDGAKLYLTTAIELGGNILDWLANLPQELIRLHIANETPTRPVTRVAAHLVRVHVHRTYGGTGRQIIAVERESRPYWNERGWSRKDGVYTGQFKTEFGNWNGWISESASGRLDTYISNPPRELHKHPHWQCFWKRGDSDWYFVHPRTHVPDVSAAILAVEKTLHESFT